MEVSTPSTAATGDPGGSHVVTTLCLPAGTAVDAGLRRLGDGLSEAGGAQTVFRASVGGGPNDERAIRVPFYFDGYRDAFPFTPPVRAPAFDDPELVAAAEVEGVWNLRDRPTGERYADLGAAYGFWRGVFEVARPSAVLVWGNTAPVSRIQLRLCREFAVPFVVIERGFLPDTLVVEPMGQGPFSLLHHHFYFRSDEPLSEPTQERLRRARIALGDTVAGTAKNGPRRVVYFGSFDLGTGCSPASAAGARRHSPFFSGSHEAAVAVAEAVGRLRNVRLLVRAHPSVPFPAGTFAGHAHVEVVTEGAAEDLLETADAVVALSTSLQSVSLLRGIPVVTLGNSELAGHGATYDVPSPEALPATIEAALERDGWEARNAAAGRLLGRMLDHHLVGLTQGSPARLDIADLATYLRALGRDGCTESAPRRQEAVRAWITRAATSARTEDAPALEPLARLEARHRAVDRERARLEALSEAQAAHIATLERELGQKRARLAEKAAALAAAKEELRSRTAVGAAPGRRRWLRNRGAGADQPEAKS